MDNIIYTIQDLINYLETLDKSKFIHGEYLETLGNQIINKKNRPLLKDLIEEDFDGNYKFKALIY